MIPFKRVHQVAKQLHLWPDKSLGADWVVQSMPKRAACEKWLQRIWSSISEWPR